LIKERITSKKRRFLAVRISEETYKRAVRLASISHLFDGNVSMLFRMALNKYLDENEPGEYR